MSRALIDAEYGAFAPDVLAAIHNVFAVCQAVDTPIDPVSLALLAAAVAAEASARQRPQRLLLLQGRERARRILDFINATLDGLN